MENQFDMVAIDGGKCLANVCSRLLESEKFVDLKISCYGSTFNVHKFVLAANSPYFKEQLLLYDKAETINFSGITATAVKHLIDSMYCKSVDVSEDDIPYVLEAAKYFKIHLLQDFIDQHSSSGEDCITIPHPVFIPMESSNPNENTLDGGTPGKIDPKLYFNKLQQFYKRENTFRPFNLDSLREELPTVAHLSPSNPTVPYQTTSNDEKLTQVTDSNQLETTDQTKILEMPKENVKIESNDYANSHDQIPETKEINQNIEFCEASYVIDEDTIYINFNMFNDSNITANQDKNVTIDNLNLTVPDQTTSNDEKLTQVTVSNQFEMTNQTKILEIPKENVKIESNDYANSHDQILETKEINQKDEFGEASYVINKDKIHINFNVCDDSNITTNQDKNVTTDPMKSSASVNSNPYNCYENSDQNVIAVDLDYGVDHASTNVNKSLESDGKTNTVHDNNTEELKIKKKKRRKQRKH